MLLGPELLLNGDFDTGDMNWWGVTGDVTNVANEAFFNNAGASTFIIQAVTEVGKRYRIVVHVTAQTTGKALVKLGWTGENLLLDGPGFYTFSALQQIDSLFIVDCNWIGTLTVNSISVREVIPMGRFTIKQKDYDKDNKQVSFHTADLNVGNIAAELAQADSLESAIEGVTLGVTVERVDAARFVNNEPIATPSGIAAQTHFQWLVTYIDDVNSRIFTATIGTADVDNDALLSPGSTLWDPTAAAWVTFIAAFEAHALSEDGNAVSISKIELAE